MKRGVDCAGVDANPSSVFAARTKTNWNVSGSRLLRLLDRLSRSKRSLEIEAMSNCSDPTFRYLKGSGMIKRGWISRRPLLKAIALKRAIAGLNTDSKYHDLLTLALLAEVIHGASNIKFGPELYCGPKKTDAEVFKGFVLRVKGMARDLGKIQNRRRPSAVVLQGDARRLRDVLAGKRDELFDALICSPPYPAEHDYTRNARLELAFLERVTDIQSLRMHKRRQIRSHTKGIYRGDNDAKQVTGHPFIDLICKEIDARVRDKENGFAKLYSTVVREYFGGMKRHLGSVSTILRGGARCAYVVGDQSAYAGVHIPTAEILGSIALGCGFEVLEIRPWRARWSSTAARAIQENILFLRRKS
jgi:hypothetical protein